MPHPPSSPSPSPPSRDAESSPDLPQWVPHGAGLDLEEVVIDEGGITVIVTSRRSGAACPACGRVSTAIHSRYARTVADLPWGTASVVLRVRPRRFRCRGPACPRRIFCERLPDMVVASGRATHGLRVARQCIGFALGGRPGARLAVRLRVGTSRMTLLRLVRAAPDPATAGTGIGTAAPRVLGVDDWAKRKGRTYGTILVDLERRCPVDLLPDRTAATLATWLRAHPGTEVLCRDRAGAYAEGARQGAPDAVQVADRWHLLANLRDAVERLLTRHHAAVLAAVAAPTAQRTRNGPAAHAQKDAAPAGPPPVPPRVRQQREVALQQARRARRMARYDAVVARHAQGWSLRAIADDLGLNRATVHRFVRAAGAGGFPERRPRARQPTQVTPFDAYLREHWAAGCHNAQALWRELRARGFTGGKSSVRDYVQPWRTTLPESVSAHRRRQGRQRTGTAAVSAGDAPVRPARPPSVRALTWLLLRRPDDLAREELDQITALSRCCLDIGIGYGLVQDFASLVRERERWQEDRGALASWVRVATAAGIPELASFAAGLRRDWAAVQEALTSPWSNGQTEGQVSRLKMLKRQMFGRATFDLLRKRVLARP